MFGVLTASVLTTVWTAGASLAEDGRPQIAFLLKTMQEARYTLDRDLFTATAQKLGADVLFESADNDVEVQQAQVDAALEAGADVIVMQPVNTGTAGALVARAHQKGIKVVGYDSMLQNGPLDAMVMQDSWAVGKLQADGMIAFLKAKNGEAKGKIALIMGQPGDANAQAMSSGVLEAVAANPGIELVAERSHVDWSPDLARETAETLLVKYENGIDAFICNNSGLAYGVMGALADEKLDDATKVFVAGADADLRNIKLVAEGKQAMEVWKEIPPLAEKAAEVAMALAVSADKPVTEVLTGYEMRNNGAVDVPTFVTPVVAVTKDTIASTVVAGGVYKAEEINSPAQ